MTTIYKSRIANAVRCDNTNNMIIGTPEGNKRTLVIEHCLGTSEAVITCCEYLTDKVNQFSKNYSNIFLDIKRTEFSLIISLGIYE